MTKEDWDSQVKEHLAASLKGYSAMLTEADPSQAEHARAATGDRAADGESLKALIDRLVRVAPDKLWEARVLGSAAIHEDEDLSDAEASLIEINNELIEDAFERAGCPRGNRHLEVAD